MLTQEHKLNTKYIQQCPDKNILCNHGKIRMVKNKSDSNIKIKNIEIIRLWVVIYSWC